LLPAVAEITLLNSSEAGVFSSGDSSPQAEISMAAARNAAAEAR
jgi:hypothetical protein